MPSAENITFYSSWLPVLAPGLHTVKVVSTIEVPGEKPAATVTETFYVDGPRFALTGSEAYSCYPAPGQIGEFRNTLPHIVFDRCTLPWERRIDDQVPRVPPHPWLALILLTDSDFSSETEVEKRRVPPIAQMTLKEVNRPEANVIGPFLNPAPYDSDMLSCRIIELPGRVFADVMPRMIDLPWLAHVREVKTDNKETWSMLREGKFSVVVCNRFPESEVAASGGKDWGIVNTVCLVSLEGWAGYLDDPGKLDKKKTCRLLVLGSWRFTCQGSSTFKSQMGNLNDKCLLRRPSLEQIPADPGMTYLNEALERGFAPLNHDLRNSDTTISWYRGPLVPMLYKRSSAYEDISCADAALCYDSQTGMFDVSHAAAWELGRLLALQDQAFAQALYRFRIDYQRWVRSTNTGVLEKLATNQRDLLPQLTNIREMYSEVLERAQYLEPDNVAGHGQANTAPPPRVPETVENWLGQAMLLYGVPFHYLVPDAMMVPPDSIRFFYLNPDWINCLLQGACSVGRTSQTDELADQLLRVRFFEVSEKLAAELRGSAKQAADKRRGIRPDEPQSAFLHWPLSGYLLRSAAVEAWIGLEAVARGIDSANKPIDPLQILRMDRLAPDMLLCIYNGKITEIEIRQPPEGIHFGAAPTTDGSYQKDGLRKIDGSHPPADRLAEPVKIGIKTRGQGVVDVNDLAGEIRARLNMDVGAFTSAEFAFEMIESPAKVTFKVRS